MSNFRNKATSAALSVTTVVWLLGATFAPVAHGATAADLNAQIQSLLAQIAALQGQLGTGSSSSYVFTRNLTVGSTGDDVKALQNVLISGGYLSASATGYFGNLTKAAVAAWQAAVGVSPASGYFGSISRAKYASMQVVVAPTPTPTTVVVAPTPTPTTAACNSTGEGSMVVTLAAAPAGNPNAVAGTNVPVYGISVKALGSDIVVNRVNLTLSVTNGATTYKPSNFITMIHAWDGTTELNKMAVTDSTLNTDSAYVYSVSFGGLNFKVPKDSTKVLTFNIDTISSIDTNRTVAVYEYGSNSLRASDCSNLSIYDASLNSTTYQRSHTFKAGGASTLTLSVAADNPYGSNVYLDASAGATDVTLLKFVATAATADATLLTLEASSSFTSVEPSIYKLYDSNGVLLASAATSTSAGRVAFTNINSVVPVGTSKSFVIKGDFPGTSNGATASISIPAAAGNSLFRKGDGTTAAPTAASAINSKGVNAFREAALLQFVSATASKTSAVNGVSSSADGTIVFKVTAKGGTLTLPTAAMFTYGVVSDTAATITSPTPALTVSSDTGTSNIADGQTATITLALHVAGGVGMLANANGYYFNFNVTNFKWTVGGTTTNNTWGLDQYKTPSVFLP